ncbi:tetratricopeptide repeat protein [Sphaerotilus mobilis]|uniref:Tetratricopeptide repeat protein n=1 Tax=Sphaerotilus mobilis TaxID=47994 RepID=A0A4Q7LW38_9BURK|nr:tetratricopeptide repeat protein [Sphaerotilus mobilis]RZS58228.1 tetratricopeptide repeat protein [Sphaerotilus mobilis]
MIHRQEPHRALAPLAPLALACVVACLTLAPSVARAQLLDELELRREGADAIVQVRLQTLVRYGRSVSTRSGDLFQIYFDAPDLRDAAIQPSQRRLQAINGLPTLTVNEEPLLGSVTQRKLVVRIDPATRMRVRAGRDNRSIELVLPGLGARVKAAPTASAPAATALAPALAAGGATVIVLQSSTDPNLQLNVPVPKQLQSLDVNTATRVVDGQTRHEIHLGPFADVAEARRALEIARARFPGAAIVTLPAAPAPTAQAAPGVPVNVEATAATLLAEARAANQAGDTASALDRLNRLLDLPPNRASREAQELIGLVRLNAGDTARARREFETFLKLYPTGPDSQRVAARLAALPAETAATAEAPRKQAATTTVNGSAGLYYYGGQSKVRSEEFRDSPISGLPELTQNPTLTGTDQKLAIGTFDLNYRHRSTEQDLRFVFRDSYTADLMPGRTSRNKLSALYVDHKSFERGTSIRLGRQSPTGGGVLGRFDGATAGYTFAPKWKVNAVAGRPTDKLQQTKRSFGGLSVDADALTPNVSGSLYGIQQNIDGLVDRRAIGSDLRYFNGGTFVSGSLDYDTILRAVNIAALQGTWQQLDAEGNAGTTVNFLLDRRSQPILMLGNALFFQDPNGGAIPVRMSDALALRDLDTLRSYVRTTTAYSNQAQLGVTTPLNERWQIGGDIRMTRVGAIAAVPALGLPAQPATGAIWSLGGQLIGSNLYSIRDTHVFNLTAQRGATFSGQLFMYNNLSALNEQWSVEPSLQVYRQSDDSGVKLARIKPGLRVSWRVDPGVTLESAADYELSKITTTTGNENTDRVFYYLGGRYDF